MRSLRSRLILGSSLVAVIPIALTMFLLAQRIEQTVRVQASERLEATLGALRAQIERDATGAGERLRLLASEPELKRLVLLRSADARAVSDYLAERRFLLGLDFLQVTDTTGAVLADAAMSAADRASGPAFRVRAAAPEDPGEVGVGTAGIEGGNGLALVARAPIRYERTPAAILTGGLVFDASVLRRLKQSSGVELVLFDAGDHVVASTPVGAESMIRPSADLARIQLGGHAYLGRTFPVVVGASSGASIAAMVPTAPADQTIRALKLTATLLGLLGLAIAVALGIAWSAQISRPVTQLMAYSRRIARGEWEEPLTLHSVRELDALVQSLNRMRVDLLGLRERLATSERQAAWSLMARQVAHEMKNPLTPIAVLAADLKRSYEQQRGDFPQVLSQAVATIEEEIDRLKRMVQEFADFARFPAAERVRCRLSSVLDDLRGLYAPEIAKGRLLLDGGSAVALDADPAQLRQALVNLIKNGLEAIGDTGHVTVHTETQEDGLHIVVSDTGPGLSDERRAQLFMPGFTTKPEGSGLGLPIVQRIVSEHQGSIRVESGPHGTTFHVLLPQASER